MALTTVQSWELTDLRVNCIKQTFLSTSTTYLFCEQKNRRVFSAGCSSIYFHGMQHFKLVIYRFHRYCSIIYNWNYVVNTSYVSFFAFKNTEVNNANTTAQWPTSKIDQYCTLRSKYNAHVTSFSNETNYCSSFRHLLPLNRFTFQFDCDFNDTA